MASRLDIHVDANPPECIEQLAKWLEANGFEWLSAEYFGMGLIHRFVNHPLEIRITQERGPWDIQILLPQFDWKPRIEDHPSINDLLECCVGVKRDDPIPLEDQAELLMKHLPQIRDSVRSRFFDLSGCFSRASNRRWKRNKAMGKTT